MRRSLFFLCFFCACAREQVQVRPHFAERTAAAGVDFRHTSGEAVKNYIVEAKGGGAALFDYDGDGYLDIYLVNGSRFARDPGAEEARDALYRNLGDGSFAEVGQQAGVADTNWGMGCVAGDIDNDGDSDLYATAYGRAALYRNEDNGRFSEVGREAGVGLEGWSTGATLGDYDRDGDLDLYVARYADFHPLTAPPRAGMWKGVMVFAGPVGLPAATDRLYRNEGEGRFSDVTQLSGVASPPPGYGLGVLFSDYDDDGDQDLYVANDSSPNFLFQNQGDGTFVDAAMLAQAALSAEGLPQASMGIAYADYDNDGLRDYFLTHFEDDYNTLYHNQGRGLFAVASARAGLAEPSLPRLGFGAAFLDYDNDGDQDLAVANGHVYPQMRHVRPDGYAEPNQLFENQGEQGNWRFVEVSAGDLHRPNIGRGLCTGDYDNDGDRDLLVANLDGAPSLLRNEGGNNMNWLTLRLVGTRSNRDGIGARVRATAAGRVQTVEVVAGGSFLGHSDVRVHLGLGRESQAERVEIRWPSGAVQHLRAVGANQFLVVEEPAD